MSDITPTKHTVYLRKETKSTRTKSVKARGQARLIVRGDSSSEDGSEDWGHGRRKYIFRCESTGEVRRKGKKTVTCSCGGNCGKDSCDGKWIFRCDGKDDKRKKRFLRLNVNQDCHCNGGDNDGWLCDVCRAVEKKKARFKFVTNGSDSDSSSCCHELDDSCSECGCCDDDSHFAKRCNAWMKAAKKRMAGRKEVCGCHRPGCNVCVIVNC